jgi:acetyl esterase/lipase
MEASMCSRFVAPLLLALPGAAQSAAPPTAPQFAVIEDVQYCTGAGKPLLMDVFIPQRRNATPTPAVLWIHGGGWEHGDKSGNSGARFLADSGFVTASLSYRLSGDAPFPAAVEDCKCAIRFLRANASNYGIDPERIGVAGSSAGGHLAELLATARQSAGLEGNGGWPDVSSRVQAAASYYGVSDLTGEFPADTVPYLEKFMGGAKKDQPDSYRRASPISYVARDDPPLLLVHGENDDGVPFDQSVRMAAAYRRIDLTVDLIAVRNAGHNFQHVGNAPISPSVEIIQERTVEFFRRNLASSADLRHTTTAAARQSGE